MSERGGWDNERDGERLRAEMKASVEAELRFHVEEEVDRLRAAGASVEEIRRAQDALQLERARRACVRIGNRRLVRRRWQQRLESWLSELELAARRLRRSPGYTAVVVLTLALVVGVNAAVFNLVDSVLLRPLPYPQADRLIQVWPDKNFNAALAREVGDRTESLDLLAGGSRWGLNLTGVGDPMVLEAAVVQPSYFRLFSATPRLGSFFGPEAALSGNDGVVVLSYGLWMERFGGDPGVIGRVLQIEGYDHEERTVIGVMGADFTSPERIAGAPDVWVPLRTDPTITIRADRSWYVNWVFGRLAPGATLVEASAELQQVAAELHAEDPVSISDEDVLLAHAQSLVDYLVGDVRPALWVLLALVSLVLVIACANLASLSLARAEGQRRDLAVLGALGAARGRLVRRVLTESLLLALLGGAGGVLIAWIAVHLLAPSIAPALPPSARLGLSLPVLFFALGVSLVAGLLVGLGPALRTRTRDLEAALRQGTAGAGGGRRGQLANHLLVVGEMALATVVVATSVAVGSRFDRLIHTDPGFEPGGVVTVRVPISSARHPDGAPQAAFARQVLERVQALPSVDRAGIIHLLPLTSSNWGFPILPDGWVPKADEPLPSANFRVVAGDYFGALRIPLVRGKVLDPHSVGPEGERPMVVNEAFVARFFADGVALGRTVRLFGDRPFQVVGVVGDVRQFTLDREPEAEMYVPYSTFSPGGMWIMARAEGDGDLLALGEAIRAAVWQVDSGTPVPTIQTLSGVLADSVARQRLVTMLLALFAGLALVLGTVGVYGVTAFAARGRRREWGLRLALGARPRGMTRRALAEEMMPIAIGLTLGVAGAFAASTLAASLIAGVDTRTPLTLIGAPLFLAAAALLAAWLPVRRTTHGLDPVEVLRAE